VGLVALSGYWTLFLCFFGFLSVAVHNSYLLELYFRVQGCSMLLYLATGAILLYQLSRFSLLGVFGVSTYFTEHWKEIMQAIHMNDFGKTKDNDFICFSGKYWLGNEIKTDFTK
jgi:hypothetical protein